MGPGCPGGPGAPPIPGRPLSPSWPLSPLIPYREETFRFSSIICTCHHLIGTLIVPCYLQLSVISSYCSLYCVVIYHHYID